MISNLTSKMFMWIQMQREKIFYTLIVYLVTAYLLRLPYINLITLYISFMPLLLTWIFILFVFKPKKDTILKFGLGLFLFNFFVTLVGISSVYEQLGDLSYFMILTYVLLSLREIQSK